MLVEAQAEADAQLAKAKARAEEIAAVGAAEASAIQAKGQAEALVLKEKNQTYQYMGEAGITDIVMNKMPGDRRGDRRTSLENGEDGLHQPGRRDGLQGHEGHHQDHRDAARRRRRTDRSGPQNAIAKATRFSRSLPFPFYLRVTTPVPMDGAWRAPPGRCLRARLPSHPAAAGCSACSNLLGGAGPAEGHDLKWGELPWTGGGSDLRGCSSRRFFSSCSTRSRSSANLRGSRGGGAGALRGGAVQ